MVVDDEEKANILNTFFSTVFTVENEMLGEIPRNNENPILRVTNLTQEEVRNRLNKIKIDKSPGPDGIHPRVLRELSNRHSSHNVKSHGGAGLNVGGGATDKQEEEAEGNMKIRAGDRKDVRTETENNREARHRSRIPASSFMFQFKNVEYSSGRNKTLLCYTVERGEGQFLSSGALSVICYVSSSPCVNCAACIARCLRRNKTLKIRLVVARLFQWEESEIRGALRGISSAGCQLRMMKSADYLHVWQNFVEPDVALNEEGENEQKSEQGAFIPWEDLEENSRYYEEKLAGILR
ncbi:unnamed protein product [Ranitomeya imitator]|uniref:Activation-induced cytidine deaminase AID domain-containing protein n=1 Tax=Ranitomeya imitator TaxID=111125 RepID=A0ABN9LLK8_9NEOB|nr:unnamed protein product [Ranitomeya imitator]